MDFAALGLTSVSVADAFFAVSAPGIYVLPVFVAVIAIVGVGWYRSRIQKDDRSVIAEYEPPEGLTPAEVGLLFTSALEEDRLVFSEIAWLVTEGYVHMKGKGKEATFRVTSRYSPRLFQLKDHQHRIMKALFSERRMCTYGDVLALKREDFQTEILASMRTRGYIRLDPRIARSAARDIVIGMVLIGFGAYGWIAGFLYTFFRVQLRARLLGAWALYFAIPLSVLTKFVLVVMLSVAYPDGTIFSQVFLQPTLPELLIAIIIAVAFSLLPQKTVKGERMYRRIRGFYEYLTIAEQHQAAFEEREEGSITDYTPYMLAFGLPSKWDSAFVLKG